MNISNSHTIHVYNHFSTILIYRSSPRRQIHNGYTYAERGKSTKLSFPGDSITDRSQKANLEYILNPSTPKPATIGKKKRCHCSTVNTRNKQKKGAQEELVNISSKPNGCMCCSDAWTLFYFHSS